jgi:hypothetical protein
MLEKAIVDAAALREAAMKNAESAILEKYSAEIKDAVDTLLEQPEEEEGLEDILGGDLEAEVGGLGDEEAEESPVIQRVDLAAAEGEEGQPAADEPIEIEINLPALSAAIDQLETGEEDVGGVEGLDDVEALSPSLAPDEMTAPEMALQEDEEYSLDEEILAKLAETLAVDLGTPDAGLGGRTTPTARVREMEDVGLAALRDDELAEENEELKKVRDELMEQINNYKSKTTKLTNTILNLKERVESVNLSNARLLYTNRVLNSTSLNERQKEKIVESISKADSVEEAKVIYETLQSAVGVSKDNKAPKSLREAVSRPSSTLPRRQNNNTNTANPALVRMKKLAGID